MKWIAPLITLAFVVACSSGPKAKTDEAMKDAEKTAESADKKMKDGEKAMKDKKAEGEKAADNAAGDFKEIKCTYGSEERAISVSTPEGGGCEVNYVRNGESRVIGTARNDMSHCEKIANRVVSNLKNNGFECPE